MVRVGLVGFGMAGRVFHAPLLSSVEGLQLAAVLERHSDLAQERYPGIKTHRKLESMLADASLDLFVVATPNASHFEVARQILEAGRNVVVDKPMAVSSAQIAELNCLATAKKALLIPFHNRRWDSDFRTVSKLLSEGAMGRTVHIASTFDRWRPGESTRLWKEEPASGGLLLDIGTHLADQALALLGSPEAVYGEVRRERAGAGANDSFDIRLRYAELQYTISANLLSTLARPRFHVRGTAGNYWKWGLDGQEAALNRVKRIEAADWGIEPQESWGTLSVGAADGVVTHPVPAERGDYRAFYTGVRDAVLGNGEPPVSAKEAWRVARVLEWAAESHEFRREVSCDWSGEPE